MPFEEMTQKAFEALAAPRNRYGSALTTTLEQVRNLLSKNRAGMNGQKDRLRGELGLFADGRVDPEALLRILGPGPEADPVMLGWMERALTTLQELDDRDDALFVAEVELGASLRDVVATALAEAGRAFGAARIVDMARSGRCKPEHEALLAAFPPNGWNREERRLAPPLVVSVHGEDLLASGLADFLDGAQKIVLVVQGKAPPAPLARLITPGCFVIQSVDGANLDRLGRTDGPGIAALLPEGAATFLHDPAGGAMPWKRLTIEFLPKDEPRRALGRVSAAQQQEDLRQLTTLAAKPPAAAAEAPEPEKTAVAAEPVEQAEPDQTERLAAWLLGQADLGGVE